MKPRVSRLPSRSVGPPLSRLLLRVRDTGREAPPTKRNASVGGVQEIKDGRRKRLLDF